VGEVIFTGIHGREKADPLLRSITDALPSDNLAISEQRMFANY
jgi:hypothetical protein